MSGCCLKGNSGSPNTEPPLRSAQDETRTTGDTETRTASPPPGTRPTQNRPRPPHNGRPRGHTQTQQPSKPNRAAGPSGPRTPTQTAIAKQVGATQNEPNTRERTNSPNPGATHSTSNKPERGPNAQNTGTVPQFVEWIGELLISEITLSQKLSSPNTCLTSSHCICLLFEIKNEFNSLNVGV